MRIYISGPMTGLPDHNYPAFAEAKRQLEARGYDVVSPHEGPELPDWVSFLRRDLKLLLDCDSVALLPGWLASEGAALEIHVAAKLGYRIENLKDWLK